MTMATEGAAGDGAKAEAMEALLARKPPRSTSSMLGRRSCSRCCTRGSST